MRMIERPLPQHGVLNFEPKSGSPSLGLVKRWLAEMPSLQIAPSAAKEKVSHGGAIYTFEKGWILPEGTDGLPLPPPFARATHLRPFVKECNRLLAAPTLQHNAVRTVTYPYRAERGERRPALRFGDASARRASRRSVKTWLEAESERLRWQRPFVPVEHSTDALGQIFERVVGRLSALDRPCPMVWGLDDAASQEAPRFVLILPRLSTPGIVLTTQKDQLSIDSDTSVDATDFVARLVLSHALAAGIAAQGFSDEVTSVRVAIYARGDLSDCAAPSPTEVPVYRVTLGEKLLKTPPVSFFGPEDVKQYPDSSIEP